MATIRITSICKRCCGTAGLAGIVGVAALWAVSSVAGNAGLAGSTGVKTAPLTLRHPHVVVLKSKRKLHLFEGDALVRTYPISLGSGPVGNKFRAGDGRTPEGVFRICAKNGASQHHRFLGINYPNTEVARRGFELGLLTRGEARAVWQADRNEQCPPWSTALGGGIGLHGGGLRTLDGQADWTAGCIALSDAHIEELFEVLRVGDRIEILP